MTEAIKRNLSVDLRPRKLSGLIGQEELVNQIRKGMSTRIPCAIMLAGESGAGKSTIAKIIALSVNCTHGTVFGEPCDECIKNEDLFNIIERNCGDLGTIDDMRALLPGLNAYPSFGRFRVILLDEAHGLGSKAQEALLLPAERGDEPNVFILCTTDPSKIKETIKRRCKIFSVPGLYKENVGALVVDTLRRAGSNLPPEAVTEALLKADISSPGFIVQAVESYIDGGDASKSITVKSACSIDVAVVVRACSQGNWTDCQRLLGQAVPSDADEIKRRTAGYFRKVLLEPKNSALRLRIAAEAIHELAANNAATIYEAGFQLSILTASIYKICQLIKKTTDAVRSGQPISMKDSDSRQQPVM